MSKTHPFAPSAALPLTLAVLLGTTALGTSPALAQNCNPGFYSATGQAPCDPAPAGSFINTVGATTPLLCLPGRYQSSIGQTTCFNSPAGYYVPTAGASAPTPASLGHFVGLPGQTSQTAANPGSYVGVTAATTVTPAPAGYYVDSPAAVAPAPAPVGRFAVGPGRTFAAQAPAGRYVGITAATTALDAPAGTYVPTSGASAPTPASPGHYVPATGFTTQFEAPAGTYVSFSGATQATQTLPGYYTDAPGLTSPYAAPPGTYVAGFGHTHVEPAPAGYYTSGAAALPAPCPPLESCVGGVPYAAPLVATLDSGNPSDTPAITFPPTFVGNVSAIPVALSTGGGEGLFEVQSASISGAGAAAFALLGLSPGSLIVPGGHLDFSVLFSPLLAGNFLADLVVNAFSVNSQQLVDFTFRLSGAGLLEDGVPEPSTLALILSAGLGAGLLGLRRRRITAQDNKAR